jgi:polysaccharide biosynthesis transport protein
VMDTRILKISVEDHDPALAMDIANSLAVAYIEFNIGNRLKSSKNTLSWMSDQLYEMKKKLEDSEEAFLAYKQRENLFSVEGKQQSIAQKIADFNDAQLEARNKRLEVNAKLQQLKLSLASGVGQMDVRSLITNPRIDNLNTQLLDAEVELSRLGKVYKSKHPKIVQITTKIDKTKKKLIQEVQKELKSLEAEGAVLLAREKAMEKTIADFDQEALSTNRKELKYSILQRSVTTNQKLYDTLLSKVEESNVVKDADVSNIRVVERAVLPLSPIKPKKKLNLALSIIFGLMTGVGLAFLLEYMDRSLRTEEDVQRYMDLAVLTVVPEADKGKSKTYGALGK